MKRITLLILLHLTALVVWGQTTSQVTVFTDHPRARFSVDGKVYTGAATFTWVEGTQHVLEFHVANDGFQPVGSGRERFGFVGWTDSSELLVDSQNMTQVVIATPQITSYRVIIQVEYLVKLLFWQSSFQPNVGGNPDVVCGVPSPDQPEQYRPGVVLIGPDCFWKDTDVWLAAGQYNIAAFPYPGWAFLGWTIDDGTVSPNAFIRVLNLQFPVILRAHFRPAKRIKLITEPLGFEVLLDRNLVPTATSLPCGNHETYPVAGPPGIDPLCYGEVDWALNSRHVIGAPASQTDNSGRLWVFDNFSNGMENHSVYQVKDLFKETIKATYVRGARVSFVTTPTGLKLGVNGRSNWPSYDFVGKPGDVYEISAPEEQVGKDGRKYVFRGWSNEGGMTQSVTVPAEAVDSGFRVTARYELLSQVVIDSNPVGTSVEVDGETCATPCAIDRPDGTEVKVGAPARRTISNVHRLDFASWSDGGPRERTITVNGKDRIQLTASYTTLYTLEAKSDPPGGASFTMSPTSADGFYAEKTKVTVTAKPNDGYRFRRWGADLEGTYPVGTLMMSAPRGVIARLDEVPFIPSAGIRNAAGETPDSVVAGGSIISIYGGRLAPYLAVGPTHPLAQTLAGVTVWVGDRILALLFVSPDQINALLPYDLPPGTYTLTVLRAGEEDVTGEFTMVRNAPGIFGRVFADRIFVMASHEDATPVTPDSPARRGELISVYATGLGPYDMVAPYGFPLPNAPEYTLVDPVEVFAGEIPLQPEFAGGAAGYSGTDVLKIRIGETLPPASTLEFKVRVGGRESNTVLLPVE